MKEIMITSSVLILCIMLIRFLCRGRIGSRLQYALWLVVAIRLIVPVTAQIALPPGMLDGFGIMDLVEDLDTNIGSLSERLEQPVSFTMRMDSLIGRQIAERVLGEEIEGFDTADGPTSIFLAGRTGVTWLDILQGIWHGGMGIMMVWMIAVNLRFRHKLHKKRREFSVPESVLARMQEKLSGKIACPADTGLPEEGAGGRRAAGHGVKVYTVEKLVSPCLYGLPGWEAIYLPEKITEQEDRLWHVLTHELCHKRHGDGFWSLLRNGLLAVYWFHPLVWAAAVLSKRDCELACDEEALQFLGEQERINYGKTLLSILSGRGRMTDLACTATTMTGFGRSIRERINYIAKKPKVLGLAVMAALALFMTVSVLAFAKSPQFSGGTWESGQICVMTGDKRIMLPETIAGISGYAKGEQNPDDLIVYQIASDREVGRFCTVSYEAAVELVDAGRIVVPLGSYGLNPQLKQYMGITPTPIVSGEKAEWAGSSSNQSAKSPFAFDGKTEWMEDDSNQSAKKPFAFDGQTEWGIEEKPEKIAGDAENGIPGTDSNNGETDLIDDDTAGQEQTWQEEAIRGKCYLYVTAEYSGIKEENLEEMLYIDRELQNAASQVIVTELNREITEKTFETLVEHKTRYLGDNSAVLALVNTLPFPEEISFGGIEMTTGETQKKSLWINCSLFAENIDAEEIEQDILFLDAAMLFASIENLEECIFVIQDGEKISVKEIVYDRKEMTRRIGVESLWKDLEEKAFCEWLKELYQRVLVSLDKEP